jgi:hypothetical protein
MDVCLATLGRLSESAARGLRAVIILSASIAIAACGGSDPTDDEVALGTGQGGSGGTSAMSLDFPIFYVQRPAPDTADPDFVPSNVLEIRQFEPGAHLYMRSSASPSAPEVDITGAITGELGDVRDVDVSFDGRKVVFAMRFPFDEDQDEEDRPTWNIWEYNLDTSSLRRVIADDVVAEQGNDRFPHYLPDGRIVFSSTRQRVSQAILLDEGKPQYQGQDENDDEPASLLHVMETDGSNIRQLSFNQSHDLDAGVMSSGHIVFSRWDGNNGPDAVSLYRVNPDGSGLQLLYGRQQTTHASGTNAAGTDNNVIQYLNPRQLQDGRILVIARPFTGTDEGGDLLAIDVNNYVENTQPILPNVGILAGPAQQRVLPTAVYTTPGPSPGGRYRSAFPLADGSNRLLVSWSQCRLIENGATVACTSQRLAQTPALPEAPAVYGIYIYDVGAGTQRPIVAPQSGIVVTDLVAAAARTAPPVILNRIAGVDYATTLDSQAAGIIDIKSVYDFDGVDRTTAVTGVPGGITAIRNPATPAPNPDNRGRFIRIEKAVSLPDDEIRDIRNTSFSPAGRFMREILGYAPIEPDGSVRVKVPANVALTFSIVDRNARRIGAFPRHLNWLQVKPGEVLQCNGCHTPSPANQPGRSHGRPNLFVQVNAGAPANGLFPNTDAALWGSPGDTMAQVRAMRMCPLNNGSSACAPSVNVVYNDLWTDPVTAGRPKDTSFDYCYSIGPTDVSSDAADSLIKHVCASRIETLSPTQAGCETNWTSNCRIVINYISHIQPLWDKPRPSAGGENRVCTSCHSINNPVDNAVPGTCQELTNGVRVPCGQLDLTNAPDQNQPDHFTSYRKLLFAHNAQELNATMNGLQDICLVTDPMTGTCLQFDVRPGSMQTLNARGSAFFGRVNNATHAGFMTEAEQRLISEWLDIGAQYYNDPFLAPEN